MTRKNIALEVVSVVGAIVVGVLVVALVEVEAVVAVAV